LNVVRINGVRQSERTGEAAILTLNTAEVLFLLLLLELTLAVHGQDIVLHANIDVLLLDPGNFDVQRDMVLVLVNIDRGRES